LLAIVEELRSQSWQISDTVVLEALQNVKGNTGLRGRWEILQESPRVVIDTGHNKAGIQVILEQLTNEKYKELHVVFGMVNDKSLSDILGMLPKNAYYYICEASIPRAKKATELYAEVVAHGLNAFLMSTPTEALECAMNNASTEDIIWVGGSTFVVADVLSVLKCNENQ
jgi:dihydrofolate synthase/folylpolyglutamate synthase